MASARILSLRAVNRALLSRQLLLKRQVLPAGQADRAARVVQVIEHLVGLHTIEMFGPERERDALTAEAERVLAFAAPSADGSVRFAPLVTSP